MTLSNEKLLGVWITVWASLTTLFVGWTINYDPVNIPKLLILNTAGFGVLTLLLFSNLKSIYRANKDAVLLSLAFIMLLCLSLMTSNQPFAQSIYGVFGRNTGFFAYFSLTILFCAAATLRTKKSFEFILYSLIFSGVMNVIYSLFVMSGRDFIGWNNIYNRILGTFGNPNFISAFLGIFLVTIFGYSLGKNRYFVLFAVLVGVVAFIEIRQSLAIQGSIVAVTGMGVVGFYFLRSKKMHKMFTFGYLTSLIILGSMALLGVLQRGPLQSLLYKPSVSLRGVYWDTGIRMGLDNPITGLGLDGYGDYYREFRSVKAMDTPGPRVVTNAAHNVFIDIFSAGGFPLLMVYLAIVGISLRAIVKFTRRSKDYDPIFVALTAGWIGYQIQSLVSINQIGLAIWGWLLSGLLIGYELSTRDSDAKLAGIETVSKGRNVKLKPKAGDGSIIKLLIGALVGFALVYPAFQADVNWRKGLATADSKLLLRAATQFPLDSYRLNNIAIEFEKNSLTDDAVGIARIATEFNPRSYDSWWIIYNALGSSVEEKIFAKSKMLELDPRNIKLE